MNNSPVLNQFTNNINYIEEHDYINQDNNYIEDDDYSDDDAELYDISSYPADYNLSTLVDKVNKGIIIPPKFQRDYIWDKQRQSRLIESFLLGLPIPQVFLFRIKNQKHLHILDGYQRITTITKFFNNEFKLKGISKTWNGLSFSQLSEEDQERLSEQSLRSIVVHQNQPNNDDQTLPSSMFLIFERLNTGGVNLSTMQIRKALCYGEFFKQLDEFNKMPIWQKTIFNKQLETDKQLKDVELLLRIFAFASLPTIQDYNGSNLKEYLTTFMQKYKEHRFNEIENKLKKLLTFISEHLPEKSFYFPSNTRLNPAVTDSFIITLLPYSDNLTKEQLISFYNALTQNNEFKKLVTSKQPNTKDAIIQRFELAKKVLNG